MPRSLRILLATLVAVPLLAGVSRAVLGALPSTPSPRVLFVTYADLKAKTSPCGCSIPKGGLARIAGALDSLRREHGTVVVLDGGGSFPDLPARPDLPPFVLPELARLGVDAMGVAPRDLQFGLAFLRSEVRRAGLAVVCANLTDRTTGRLAFPASRIVERGGRRIGVFALIGDRFDLGPARDSLRVEDPEGAAERTIAALRAQGAEVVVLLAQMGRVGGEDLASAVPGVDAVVLGNEIPVLQQGRRVGDGIASYAGDQGQHLGLLEWTAPTASAPSAWSASVLALGPERRGETHMLAAVQAFEDAYNERMREEQRRIQALADADPEQDPVDHFVGGEVCARCHPAEAAQWATTAHSIAWETLVRERKDSTPECIGCHVVGYGGPGGFRTAESTPHLVDVQCENCHGMGTLHLSERAPTDRVGEATCIGCHTPERDPGWNYARKLPLILHSNTSGESIRIVEERRRAGYDQSH